MATVTTTRAAESEDKVAGLEHRLRELRDHLLDVKRRLDEDIRRYPTPIPRCDAQFNHLFEERARVNLALERIEMSTSGDRIELLAEFLRSPSYLDDATEAELRARIGADLSSLTD
ncbi:MAG TPA: hypothetical protein VMM27_14000 [Casimicrobiaceae bacterium]|nr:hypothetical protein [Casimicrobiaceae bacterium]